MGKLVIDDVDMGKVSDGFHTFDELYEHRIELFLALCRVINRTDDSRSVWKSRYHSDGTRFEGWFICGIGIVSGRQITYHMPDRKWDDADFDIRMSAPEFDGHTAEDVLHRLGDIP